jgi:hypothetical protein
MWIVFVLNFVNNLLILYAHALEKCADKPEYTVVLYRTCVTLH